MQESPRLGFLSTSNVAQKLLVLDAFRQELRELGWVEGKNITIEYRFAEGKSERLPELAAELVRLKVDLIVTSDAVPPVSRQESNQYNSHRDDELRATPSRPGWLPVSPRPGGNVTGVYQPNHRNC